ncbi:MAG TPA: hypothetical protein VLZ07_05230 [Syntrophales bacterium]|nr:hypothetical protein [Syntrophales bacterium]
MTLRKKLLLKLLWFLVGMTVIVALPLLIIEQCSQPWTSWLRGNNPQKRIICVTLKSTCRLYDTNQAGQRKER